jgi:hypothetical protein
MAIKDYYKSPLIIYVVWHHANAMGLKIAEDLYNSFCRDTNSPLSRGLNIPVRFRYLPQKPGKVPMDIDTSVADRTAVVLLIDDEMFGDSIWYEYIQRIAQNSDERNRIFPVALSKYAFSIDEDNLSRRQFIDLRKFVDDDGGDARERLNKELRSRLLHDLARLFLKAPAVSNAEAHFGEPPVKLFVSHAKADGEGLALRFRDYVQSQTKLKTFFDVNDIADADDFERSSSIIWMLEKGGASPISGMSLP